MDASPTDTLSPEALNELLGFPLRLLGQLPVPVRIELEVPGLPRKVALSTEPQSEPASELEFRGHELAALALGVEAQRLWPGDFKGFCLAKLHDRGFVVTEERALTGVFVSSTQPATLRAVLAQLDLRVTSASVPVSRRHGLAADPMDAAVEAA